MDTFQLQNFLIMIIVLIYEVLYFKTFTTEFNLRNQTLDSRACTFEQEMALYVANKFCHKTKKLKHRIAQHKGADSNRKLP